MRACCFHYSIDLIQIFFPDYVKLIGYLTSTVNVVSSNYCIGTSPRIKITLFLLSICTNELISAPKINDIYSKASNYK